MKFFSVQLCYAVCAAMVVIDWARCEPIVASSAEDDSTEATADKQPKQANRRSVIEDYHYGLQYAPSYHSHFAPAEASYHGHVYGPAAATHCHHSYAAAAPAVQHYPHAHAHAYAPGHYHAVLKPHQPVIYQSVVHTYPTATTVVHKPVPVPVAHPVPVPVARPVAVEVPRPYPVPVNRPYPVTVVKPVPVPVAQPYPVTVYRPYPVPVYRPQPVARPVVHRYAAARVPAVVRVPLVRYPAAQPSYVHHSHAYAPHYHHGTATAYAPHYHHGTATAYATHYHGTASAYAPHYHGTAAAYPAAAAYSTDSSVTSYLQQLAAVKAAAGGVGADYDVNENVVAQQQQQAALQDDYSFLRQEQQEAEIHHHDDAHHAIDHLQDGGSGYPSLTTGDDTFKTSLGVPNVDYTAGKKK